MALEFTHATWPRIVDTDLQLANIRVHSARRDGKGKERVVRPYIAPLYYE